MYSTLIHFYTPARRVGVYRNHPVRLSLSVCPSVTLGILAFIFKKVLPSHIVTINNRKKSYMNFHFPS